MNTAPRIKAGTAYGCAPSGCNGPKKGECMNLCLHRVDASTLPDNRTVMVAGESSTLPHATEFAGPEPIDFASFRPLVAACLVIAITLLVGWRFV